MRLNGHGELRYDRLRFRHTARDGCLHAGRFDDLHVGARGTWSGSAGGSGRGPLSGGGRLHVFLHNPTVGTGAVWIIVTGSPNPITGAGTQSVNISGNAGFTGAIHHGSVAVLGVRVLRH